MEQQEQHTLPLRRILRLLVQLSYKHEPVQIRFSVEHMHSQVVLILVHIVTELGHPVVYHVVVELNLVFNLVVMIVVIRPRLHLKIVIPLLVL